MIDKTDIRYRMLYIAAKAGEGHVPSALSVWDVLWTYYSRVKLPEDIFILSKGHASLALYLALVKTCYIPAGALDNFCEKTSLFGGHPTIEIAGVEATTGSLGHGLPIAVGRALGLQLQGLTTPRVTVLCGDGEMMEGSCHEALRLAGHYNLRNLVLAIDCNRSHGDGAGGHILDICRAHGFFVHRCNGHDEDKIVQAFQARYSGPLAIVFDTIKGKGIKAMEADPNQWHHKKITLGQIGELLEPSNS